MAGQMQVWWTMRLLILFSLLSLTQHFEVREDEWEELSPDIAALHRLRGLSDHMIHERLNKPSKLRAMFMNGDRVDGSTSRGNIDQNLRSMLDDFEECENFAVCVIRMEQDFDTFLEDIDEQKIQDYLLGASEISHSYSQKILITTDKDKSTTDRVQQEYNLDPHYSVKVSEACLHNDSCVPEADSYTVVKIFGSVSEDGQTVSGLSGLSLAELMLKLPLKAAPVFSLDGNTTTDFQHNFIQVFMVRGIKTVLETNWENQQIYQVMNQPDSVSSYRIPQRPVDHTTQYDHQQIIIMEDDPVVRKAATYLYEKHPSVSSVYVLDENQRPKLIHGDPVPLSKDSRLTLVGHGVRDNSGEMRLGGYRAQDVAEIVQQTSRISDKIKTTTVVACEVGSDKAFVETLLKELHGTHHMETELHLRDTVIQVRHTGEKITQEITPDGLQWRHKDDSKKVVANIDRNGDVIITNEPGSKGRAIFTNERNFLMGKKNKGTIGRPPVIPKTNTPDQNNLIYRDNWPDKPRTFINQNVFGQIDQNNAERIKSACDKLEALTWGMFHSDQPAPKKIHIKDLKQIGEKYVIGKKERDKMRWIDNEQELKKILSKCYEIKSGEDVRNIIRHYAKTGEDEITHLMVKDWIYAVDPKDLYVYPVGKKIDNNQLNNAAKINEIKKSITLQTGEGKESYTSMRSQISDKKGQYVQYVKDIFLGQHTPNLELSTEAKFTTYFTASVISESARNFRTFPLVLMALDMYDSRFFFDNHPMARGGTWINPNRRGFSGTEIPEGSNSMVKLIEMIKRETKTFNKWRESIGDSDVVSQMLEISATMKIFDINSVQENSFRRDYTAFKEQINQQLTSGTLGGYDDGYVTLRDLNSASELENSVKLQSYFSRASASLSQQIHSQLKTKYGENLAGLRVQEGSARMENGQFICQLVSNGPDSKLVEFRVELSPENQRYNENMLQSIDTAVNDLEMHGSTSSHQASKYVERTGTAVGTLGLMLGMKGAVRAFEQGDIKDGVIGSLETAHGVTDMTTSVIAKRALSSKTRIAAAVMKSPVTKGILKVIPIVGIGFGIFSVIEDLKRGDALGYIDAVLDVAMIGLDVLVMAKPELILITAPLQLALSVVRMVIDDVYMGVQNELNSLPKDAGVLDKVGAAFVGIGKGILHFLISVASIFYDWRYDEIEEGRKFVHRISDYRKYYVIQQQDGIKAIDFSSGDSSWNGGGINFCLADQGQSEFCMDYFVSSDESFGKKCWNIDTQGSKDIILGQGESHQLQYKTLQKKILMVIPAGSVKVVSGYEAVSYSRYGTYKGNKDSNRFFAVQKAEDKHVIEVMLSYYYQLYGQPGDDMFFLGPQRSYVEGSGGKDTYIIPENGGNTIINNYDPLEAIDTLHFSVDYSRISVSKSGNDVVLMYEDSLTVTIRNWFLGESYRHMNMMSGDGVMFEISSTVVSSVQLVARGINKMFKTQGETVNASQPLLQTVTNILGSRYDDVIIGNRENNLIDGRGGRDYLIGGEGEDIYLVKNSSVLIENYSTVNTTDLTIIEANIHTFKVRVKGKHVVLSALHDNTDIHVTLKNWFRSPADRHLLIITKDLITFTISDNKADCLQNDPFTKCIRSRSIDYSKSKSALVVDLQEDEALHSVTEVRGSKFDDVIRGNKENNIFTPGRGNDVIQGRGGEDWYVITPGQGVKTINNQSPDRAMDILFLKEQYKHIAGTCEGQSIIILVNGNKEVILQNWFKSKSYQHLQIRTSDGITAGLMSNLSSCGEFLMVPLTVDYRNQRPEPLPFESDIYGFNSNECFRYRSKNSPERLFCGYEGKVTMNNFDSVKEMYGSSGFDIMVGNSKENVLDPYSGGALMFGGEGKDTYIIKHEYGNNLMIDNYAEDQNIDTVLVDIDFLDGSQIVLDSSTGDLNVTITTMGEQLQFSLLNYNNGYQYQHIDFQTSDGVHFKLNSLNSSGDVPFIKTEAFKVTLKQSQTDCHLDLNSHRNLSKVHTVQGCPSQSNDILGNNQDNALIGGWKDDALDGGEGDDTLIGGNGADILIGGMGDDTLYGEDGYDTMMGNSGWDVFIPGPGADLVDGGPGRDTVLYQGDHEKGKGVYVNLLTGQGRYADAEGDVLKDVENVIGTIYSDILVSGYESSLLKGSDGNDILVSTGGDYLVGGDGNDIYMLAFHNGSVTIDNCAKDNATDVLYLGSRSPLAFDCQISSEEFLLILYKLNQPTVKIALPHWISDEGECGHLMLVFREVKVSVDSLLQECQLREKERVRSLVIISLVCIGLVIFHCVFILLMFKKSSQGVQRQKTQEQTETELVSMMADVM